MLAVMPVYRRVGRYILLLHLLVLMAVYKHDIFTLSLPRLVQDSENLERNVCLHSSYKKVQHSTKIVGLFYRPPNSDSTYLFNIEDSIGLAFDTGINDMIITGDFNLNATNPNTLRKIESICSQFSLYQLIEEPTHFNEQSSSSHLCYSKVFKTKKHFIRTPYLVLR